MPADSETLLSIVTAVVSVVLGGVATHFKLFLPSKDNFRNRTRLKKTALTEKMAGHLTVLLQRVRSLSELDDPLRGDGREDPDLVGDYSTESFRTFAIYHRLEVLDRTIRRSYFLLYLSIALGIIDALLAWLVPTTRGWVIGTALGLIGIQMITVFVAQLACWKLEEYEDIT